VQLHSARRGWTEELLDTSAFADTMPLGLRQSEIEAKRRLNSAGES
jgi:hypothetical protein